MPTINDSVQYLKGVGPAFAKKFEKLGIVTIRDLLLCYPRKYIDYTQPYTVVSGLLRQGHRPAKGAAPAHHRRAGHEPGAGR